MMPAETRRFVSLFGGPRESSDLVGIARAACREGYAVIAVKPGLKEPICTLTQRQAKAADRVAANAARTAGKGHWEKARHKCGREHAITDPKEAERVFKRLVELHPDLNIGLEVGQSRLIAVDTDTIDEVRSFTELWAQREDRPEMADAAPTVRTPGKIGREGEWVHKDGGHFWFLLPEDMDFSESPVSTSMPIGLHAAQAQVMFSDSLVLVPPSVRPEGPYVMSSDIFPAPQWLLDDLIMHVEGHQLRRDRHLDQVRDGTDAIDIWSSVTSWEELLSADGWTTSGRPDNCGCTIWTRPGDWSSPKSATAHEPGCIKWDNDATGHGFLHVWTDKAPEHIADYIAATRHKSMSKLQYVAWRDFAGDMGDAMRALGIHSNAEPDMSDDEVFSAALKSMEDYRQGKDEATAVEVPVVAADEEDQDIEDEASEPTWWEQQVSGFPTAIQGLIRSEFTKVTAREAAKAIREALRAKENEAGRGQRVNDYELSAAELFAMPHTAPEWTVDGLLEVGQMALLAAPAKGGKTTLMGNLLRSLTQGEPFLGQFPVPQLPGAVYVMDIEMTRNQHIRWLQEMGISSASVYFQHLRGRVADFNLLDDTSRTWWAQRLRSLGVSFLIVDPLSPVLQASGLDEDKTPDTDRWFSALKQLCLEAGVSNSVVCHHHGHSGERARGSSNLLATPDALWTIVKSHSGARYFSAMGRDVDVPESCLEFDLETRKLSIADVGEARSEQPNRKPDPGNDPGKQDQVMAAIRGRQGLSMNELKARVKIKGADVPKVVDALKLLDQVVQVPKGQSFLHYTSDYQPTLDED
jgi:hypothetical protein